MLGMRDGGCYLIDPKGQMRYCSQFALRPINTTVLHHSNGCHGYGSGARIAAYGKVPMGAGWSYEGVHPKDCPCVHTFCVFARVCVSVRF